MLDISYFTLRTICCRLDPKTVSHKYCCDSSFSTSKGGPCRFIYNENESRLQHVERSVNAEKYAHRDTVAASILSK